jgi:hypothetical protein
MSIDKLIQEVVLEMLKENDPKLIDLLKQHDSVYGTINESSFVDDKVKIISEMLGVKPQNKEHAPDNRLLELAGIKK